jgi:uncharacterized peroxidase-related enzyme
MLLVLGEESKDVHKDGEKAMERIKAIKLETAERKARELLDRIYENLGMIPNLMKVMANSPAVLEAYIGMSNALSKGSLPPKLREQIALYISEINQCSYCLAAHSAIGRMEGLTEEELVDSRRGISPNRATEAALQFASIVLEKHGHVSEENLMHIRNVGYSDAEISEVIANVALTVFTNYLNSTAGTVVDYPEGPGLEFEL